MLAHLLQSTLFAAATWLATLALRRNHARARHALWLAASVKFLIPFALFVSLGAHWVRPAQAPVPLRQMRFVMGAPPDETPVPSAPLPAPRRDWVSPLVWLLWAAGSAGIAIRWWIRWRAAAARLRDAQPWHALPGIPVPLRSVDSAVEPAVVGVFRPVLVFPQGIEQRLTAEQLDAVLAHELCHVRHRDNLAAAIHMVVEALFWFHPLVWWIGARLMEEREQACDEEVLQQGGDRATYAESILRVCQVCVESPVPCISGITGADLKQRIRSIMSGTARHRLEPAKKWMLATLAAGALMVPLAVGLMHPARMQAQAPLTSPPLRFEAASVKLSADQETMEVRPRHPLGHLRWHAQLSFVVAYAYNLEFWRISDPPDNGRRLFNTMYDIDATTGPNVTEAQVRVMLQTLLAERFHLVAHRQTKDGISGYVLTVARDGPKMEPVNESDLMANDTWATGAPAHMHAAGEADIEGHAATMVQLSETLQRLLGTSVIDQTGLTGHYNFTIQYAPDGNDNTPVIAGMKQVGLKVEKYKGPVEFLVIDRVGPLVEN